MRNPTVHAIDNRLLINVLLLALTFFVLLNFFFVYQMRTGLPNIPGQGSPPPKIELTMITVPDCPECTSLDNIAGIVRSRRVNITKENKISWMSAAGQGALSQYNLTRAPAIIITGETQTLFIEPFWRVRDALVLTNAPPPYMDVKTGTVKGRVTMTVIVPKSCKECFSLSNSLSQINDAIMIQETKTLDADEDSAKALIKRYELDKVPSLILSKDAELYSIINRSWEELGTWESDGSLVLRSIPPPFISTADGDLQGMVTATYLVDKGCKECYDVNTHKDVLSELGLAIKDTVAIDISTQEGKVLIYDYKITGVPTMILSKEASMYPMFLRIWPQVGTEEKDGRFVFRDFEALGKIKWKELPSGKIMGSKGNESPEIES